MKNRVLWSCVVAIVLAGAPLAADGQHPTFAPCQPAPGVRCGAEMPRPWAALDFGAPKASQEVTELQFAVGHRAVLGHRGGHSYAAFFTPFVAVPPAIDCKMVTHVDPALDIKIVQTPRTHGSHVPADPSPLRIIPIAPCPAK